MGVRTATVALLLGALTGCGSGGGGVNGTAAGAVPGGGADEDRQVLVDLAKRACTERADLKPNVETAVARRGCECAIDQLYQGKSADEMMEMRRQSGQDEIEDRAAEQCLAGGR